MGKGLMLYDADCGFCTRTAQRVPLLGTDVEMAALQSKDLPALGVDPVRALEEMPFVHTDGTVVYGHHAWAAILRSGPLPVRLAGVALGSRIIEPLARRVYAWVSSNRALMPGGSPSCSLEHRR